MKLKFKPLPAVMTVISALYLIYVISSESTTLVADTVGGDPGGKLLPTIIAIFLLVGFLFITLRERPTGEEMNKETLALFLITLGATILYVLLIKTFGFIILSSVLLYSLEYIYTTIGEKRKPLSAIIGGVITVAATSGVYTLMRLISKTLGRLARRGAIASFFGNNTVLAVICLAFILLVVVLLALFVVKPLSKKGLKRESNAAIITLATILLIYVIFKQFFLVALAPGLLNF